MTQSMRPISDITNGVTGDWTDLDGTSPDTGDWAYGANNSTDVHEVLLTDLSASEPDSGTCTVNIYQSQADSTSASPSAPTSGGTNADFDIEVYEGATQRAVATSVSCNEGSFAQYNSLTFSSGDVSDWSDVRLRFTSNGTGGNPNNRRSAAWCYAELITPDPGPSQITATGAWAWAKGTVDLEGDGELDATGAWGWGGQAEMVQPPPPARQLRMLWR